jgi:hypothetical protein
MKPSRLEYIYKRLNELDYNHVLFTPIKMRYSRDYHNYYGITISPCRQFIRYVSYGSSAVSNTIEDLQWVISNIFKNDGFKEIDLLKD